MHDVQAARGASLNTRGPESLGLALAVVAADQGTKAAALATLEPGDRVTVIPGLIDFTLLRNPGAAFGTAAGMTIVLTAVALATVVTVLVLMRRMQNRGWAWGLGLLLGGAVGNLVDRLVREPAPLRGHVIDFIDYWGWFVGNVADIALTGAAAVIVWLSYRGIGIDDRRADV